MFNLNITTEDLLQIATAAGKSAALSLLAPTLSDGHDGNSNGRLSGATSTIDGFPIFAASPATAAFCDTLLASLPANVLAANTREAHSDETKLYELNGFFGRGSGLCSPSQLPPRLPPPPPRIPRDEQLQQQLIEQHQQYQYQLQQHINQQQQQLKFQQQQHQQYQPNANKTHDAPTHGVNNMKWPSTIRVVIPPSARLPGLDKHQPKDRLNSSPVSTGSQSEVKFGLRLTNYWAREPVQPNMKSITKDKYARCLNLVRRNELENRQQRKHNPLSLLRPSMGARPLRLRRAPGQCHVTITASASYRATRRVGLQ